MLGRGRVKGNGSCSDTGPFTFEKDRRLHEASHDKKRNRIK